MKDIPIGSMVEILPGADFWKVGPREVLSKDNDNVYLLHKDGYDDEHVHGDFLKRIYPDISKWFIPKKNGAVYDFGYPVLIVTNIGMSFFYESGEYDEDSINAMDIKRYMYLPKFEDPLPKCGVCGGRPFTTEVSGGWAIMCENNKDHIRIFASTYTKAVEYYKKQRGIK